MPSPRITIKNNAGQVRADVAKIKNRTLFLGPPLKAMAQEIATLIDDTFDQQTGPSGEAWAPLKPATKKRRARRRKSSAASARILQDTAVLRRSWFARFKPPNLVVFGTNVPYAAPHQAGSKNGSLPARRMGPVRLVGGRWQLIRSGPAGAAWNRVREQIARYIATGKVF